MQSEMQSGALFDVQDQNDAKLSIYFLRRLGLHEAESIGEGFPSRRGSIWRYA